MSSNIGSDEEFRPFPQKYSGKRRHTERMTVS